MTKRPQTHKILRIDHPPEGAPDTCIVADSPHSGRVYPPDFSHACPRHDLRLTEDAYADKLFGFFPALGAPLLKAVFPRAYIDVNRRIDEENKGLFRETTSPWARQERIYDRPLTARQKFNRIAACYIPYYRAREELLECAYERHGRYVYIDCHTMYSRSRPDLQDSPYDIILGTRDGETCDPAIARGLEALLRQKGYAVATNIWLKGQNLVHSAGAPEEGRHAIQVEVNRRLYLDEAAVRPHPGFVKLKRDLRDVFSAFAALVSRTTPCAMPCAGHAAPPAPREEGESFLDGSTRSPAPPRTATKRIAPR